MRFLFILCGLPFSGKSTITNFLTEHYGFKKVSFDDICKSIELIENRFALPEETMNLAFDQISLHLKTNSVIWDALNDTRAKRDQIHEFALHNNAMPITLFVDVPIETIQERRKQSSLIKDRSLISDKNFDLKLKSFESPIEEINTYTITDIKSLQKVIANLK